MNPIIYIKQLLGTLYEGDYETYKENKELHSLLLVGSTVKNEM